MVAAEGACFCGVKEVDSKVERQETEIFQVVATQLAVVEKIIAVAAVGFVIEVVSEVAAVLRMVDDS